MNDTKTDNNPFNFISCLNERDIFLLKQLCDVEDGNLLVLRIEEGRVILKANGAFLPEKDRKPLTAKLREFTDLFPERTARYNRNGTIKRKAERKSDLTGIVKLFLSKDGGIDRNRMIIGNAFIFHGIRLPRQASQGMTR